MSPRVPIPEEIEFRGFRYELTQSYIPGVFSMTEANAEAYAKNEASMARRLGYKSVAKKFGTSWAVFERPE